MFHHFLYVYYCLLEGNHPKHLYFRLDFPLLHPPWADPKLLDGPPFVEPIQAPTSRKKSRHQKCGQKMSKAVPLVVYLPIWKTWKSLACFDDYSRNMEQSTMFQSSPSDKHIVVFHGILMVFVPKKKRNISTCPNDQVIMNYILGSSGTPWDVISWTHKIALLQPLLRESAPLSHFFALSSWRSNVKLGAVCSFWNPRSVTFSVSVFFLDRITWTILDLLTHPESERTKASRYFQTRQSFEWKREILCSAPRKQNAHLGSDMCNNSQLIFSG